MHTSKAKIATKVNGKLLAWLSLDMLLQTAASTLLSATVYLGHTYMEFPLSEGVNGRPHMITGLILGMLLVARVVIGVTRKYEGVAQVMAFLKGCRTLAVLSCSVAETLTISAAAEVEKKAVQRFRYELGRQLNLAFYCYSLMLQGLKLAVPPTSLRSTDGKQEAEILAAVENPAIMVTKNIAALVEQQRVAKRVSNEQSAVLMSKIADLVETYHASLSMTLAPPPVYLTSFTYFFTAAWAYTAGITLAVIELGDNTFYVGTGLVITVCYTAFISLFVFGLYEAGSIAEAPMQSVTALLDSDHLLASLSDDLSSLIGDSVPVFLPKADKPAEELA